MHPNDLDPNHRREPKMPKFLVFAWACNDGRVDDRGGRTHHGSSKEWGSGSMVLGNPGTRKLRNVWSGLDRAGFDCLCVEGAVRVRRVCKGGVCGIVGG